MPQGQGSAYVDKNASQFNNLTNPYVDNFTSVSGSDIVGSFGHVEFINLQGISVSVNREVHPIYVMGRTDPVSFVRGKRGVAGSLVTVCHDRGSLHDIVERYGVYAHKQGDSTRPGDRRSRQERLNSGNSVLSEPERLGYELRTPEYYDQLPPFDVTLVGRSDVLAATISRVGGVFIVSMGTGISVDDNSIEQQMTWVALYYEDWRPAGRRNWKTEEAAGNAEYDPFADRNQGAEPNPGGRQTVEDDDQVGDQFNLSRTLDAGA